MPLCQLKNEELNQRLKSLVRQEREMLTEILHHIAEVDRIPGILGRQCAEKTGCRPIDARSSGFA